MEERTKPDPLGIHPSESTASQQLNYRSASATVGKPWRVDATFIFVTSLNSLWIGVAIIWSCYSWIENLHEREGWGFWGIIWFCVSGILVFLQACSSLWLSYDLWRSYRYPQQQRRFVFRLCLIGIAITLGQFMVILLYDLIFPTRQMVGR